MIRYSKEVMDLANILLNAHLKIKKNKLVFLSFGNISAKINDHFLIKPSGVDYNSLSKEHFILINIKNSKVFNHYLKPSVDTPIHLEIYNNYDCNAIVHTHSKYATSLAIQGRPIYCNNTTHADYFDNDIYCTRQLTEDEVNKNYEQNIGKVIINTFNMFKINPEKTPAILIKSHGVFTWGKSVQEAVEKAMIVEYLAEMQFLCNRPSEKYFPDYLLNKHYNRKNGCESYYGQ